ncbi:alcohol dehydrogenase catalytic domain-containing protein [Mucilaginibacter roseus]|uniref:Alcohol dehydrogenase catalytic domain-containing protein n=1 Tax=Mucilaginibacter roseus TaxID=1528868 RepID=A0ABS8U0B5_9SPHI|nr:alcohol dehydrogenase catalytic domain-containing protein [Mucilaginibacter roseus]MCD8740548.1 alcohol dehydrogenase catalytic domain-containing protein [Mucilaginibacter roseus]
MRNLQITTRWLNKEQKTLKTTLEEASVPELRQGEILVEMLAIPMHGSFWLASHPDGIHPRRDEFMIDDEFVFGNGGVGRVIRSNADAREIAEGDYVTVFGHVPCEHYDCYACTVLHRYTECDYGESTIIGHGKHSYDGSYAKYVVLPKYSYEICYRKHENPTIQQLMPFMFGFLIADVRNALTRHADSLRMRRLLLVGSGFSGLIAAYIHNRTCPESRIFVLDSSEERLAVIKAIDPESIETYVLPEEIVGELNNKQQSLGFRHELNSSIEDIAKKMKAHFGGRGCNLLFDSSSGNTAPIWDNKNILSPSTHCIPFGFGSHYILLNKDLIQFSGLNIMMSRGVGNIRNRKEVIELIKAGASAFIEEHLIEPAIRLQGLEEGIKYIDEMHNPPKPLHQVGHAYIIPNPNFNG